MQKWYKEKLRQDGINKFVGTTYQNLYNETATIIDYIKANDVIIQYDNGYIEHRGIESLKNKQFKNPYSRTVYNKGYIGEGEYKIWHKSENGKYVLDEAYDHWQHMICRCYSEKEQHKYPTYNGCTVCEEWFNYQNFAKWYYENKWDDIATYIDKDILKKGNKIYSPENCILVDNALNVLFVKAQKVRGNLPIGVIWQKNNHNYVARCSIYGKGMKHIGVFDNPIDAFYAYKNFKENHIKHIADEYKAKYPNFPNKLYKALYNYQVEITD